MTESVQLEISIDDVYDVLGRVEFNLPRNKFVAAQASEYVLQTVLSHLQWFLARIMNVIATYNIGDEIKTTDLPGYLQGMLTTPP